MRLLTLFYVLASCLVFVVGCSVFRPSPHADDLQVGRPLPSDGAACDVAQLIGCGSISEMYSISRNGVQFLASLDDRSLVSYIETRSPDFITPEGVRVGLMFHDLPAERQLQLRKEPGWAFVVPLASGWNAAFTQGDTMSEGQLAADATVEWLFKR